MSLPAPSSRRYDLDWLRVIAFGLLILYHIGMGYGAWDWHVKSAHASDVWRLPMLMVNPWRLSLLFFISGVAVRFASDSLGSARFARSRAWRLGLPILFGMIVVVMPQSYFELLAKGEVEPGILSFWPRYLAGDGFSIITPTWNHLWYVVYLLVYILLISPIAFLLRRIPDMLWFRRVAARPLGLLFAFALPFVAYEYVLEPRFPTTHALMGDWNTHAASFTMFLIGFWAAKSDSLWAGVRRGLPWFLAVAFLLGMWRALGETGGAEGLEGPLLDVAIITWPAANVLYAWAVILSLLAFAQRYLAGPSSVLRYLTGAIFCYYILHQTLTVSLIALLGRQGLSGAAELALVTIGTIGGCALGYEAFRRVPLIRVALGIKGR